MTHLDDVDLAGSGAGRRTATCTAFGTIDPASTLSDDVVGVPAASPGRTEMKPSAAGLTA